MDVFWINVIILQRLAGGEHLGFNNSVFLSERESADRNYALGFFMREYKCYPEKTNLRECMDFYFQVRRMSRWS
jgi:glutaminase